MLTPLERLRSACLRIRQAAERRALERSKIAWTDAAFTPLQAAAIAQNTQAANPAESS